MSSEKKTTLSVSESVRLAAKKAAEKARISLYEYVCQALDFAIRHMEIGITKGKKP